VPIDPRTTNKPNDSKNPLPSPTLPKGGGAIRDIGEKFSATAGCPPTTLRRKVVA
jgi:hypothetical protein